jgi:hypothetical protein
MLTPNDPCYEAYQKMKKLIDNVNSLPDWETMIEYEYVRQTGDINMLGFDRLQRYAFDRSLYNLVTWLQECKEMNIAYISNLGIAYEYYESKHGPSEKWITKEFKLKVKQNELNAKEQELLRAIKKLQKEREELE